MSFIRIRGARTHNLDNIDLDLPRGRLIVFTGLSGSGKSSLAFDTLYAEGQRRYVESLSTYARQFLSLMEKPDVDHIEGLSPAIAIEQKTASHNPRSTVGTVTEVYDFLRLLYARAGEPRCPVHGVALRAQTVTQMVDQALAQPEGARALLLAPAVSDRKGETREVLDQLRRQGFVRARIDGEVMDLDDVEALSRRHRHTVEVVIDRFVVRADHAARLAESFETALAIGDGIARLVVVEPPGGTTGAEITFSARHACGHCGYSIADPEPRLFSFNNPAGACPACDGLGVQPFFDPERVIRDDTLSLAAGAVQGWDRRNPFYFKLLESLARHYGFSVDTPFGELPAAVREVILHGSGDQTIAFSYHGGRRRRHRFEGVLPNLERRYRETDSSAMREDLARFVSTRPCPACQGSRLREEARNVFIGDLPIHALTALSIGDALERITHLGLSGHRATIAERVVQEVGQRLRFLVNVGLDYLSLDRTAETLSGGEAQRIRLASQIGSGLTGVMYVLDEPSIGLHQRDNDRLIETLRNLRDLGNTVIVVEHDEEAIRAADHVVDLGPGAGVHGGRVVAEGPPAAIEGANRSLTGRYLAGIERIEVPRDRRPMDRARTIRVRGARGNNLRSLDVEIPVGLFTCVTGVSGSGKSTLVNDTLYPAMAQRLYRTRLSPSPFDAIEGMEQFDKVIDIDQAPIGRTPRSNAATYTGLFTPIRDLFAATPEARARGYKPGRFSFNVRGGRCEACEGDGMLRVEMHFLPDIYVLCDTCKGARYNRETLEVRYKGRTIAEVLEMTVEDAAEFFAPVPAVRRKLDTLVAVGLGYLRIGQSATTLSGGEAQRMKLSRELSRRDTGRTLYILDEPTTGLHFHDVRQLLGVLHRLRDDGNTIVVIEHNLDVIKTADWIIDLGPAGGDGGGTVVAAGTPEAVSTVAGSFTGYYLRPLLHPPAAHAG